MSDDNADTPVATPAPTAVPDYAYIAMYVGIAVVLLIAFVYVLQYLSTPEAPPVDDDVIVQNFSIESDIKKLLMKQETLMRAALAR